MKNLSFLALSLAFLALVSCQRDPVPLEDQPGAAQPAGLTVEEARASFEAEAARFAQMTRTENDDDNRLILGDYTLDWDEASLSVGEILYHVDIPVTPQYRYFQITKDSLGGNVYTPVYSKAIVVKNPESDNSDSYIRFLMPDPDFAEARNESYHAGLLNGNPMYDFSGLSVYTLLDGYPASAGRYEGGVLLERAFLWDTVRPIEQNWERLEALLAGMTAVRMQSRGNDSVGGIGYENNSTNIDTIVVIGWPRPKPVVPEITDPDPNHGEPSTNPIESTMIIDGGGDNPDSDKTQYKGNPNIKATKETTKLLNTLKNDCMGEKLIGMVSAHTTIGSWNETGSEVRPDFTDPNNPSFKIKIGTGNSDAALIEELVHVLQMQGRYRDDSYAMNREVEAHLGGYNYRDRINNLNGMQEYLGTWDGVIIFNDLRIFFANGDFTSDKFFETYDDALMALRVGLKGYENFPASNDKAKKNLDILKKITEDCNKKKR